MPGRLTEFFQSAAVRRAAGIAQKLLSLAAAALIARQLYQIGWTDLAAALPRAPGFYAAFVALYLIMPLTDCVIYGRLWGTGVGLLPALIRKKIYNDIVVDYSGEGYLYLWGKRNTALGDRKLLSVLKDVNLLSGVASNAMTLVLVVGFAAWGSHAVLAGIDPPMIQGVLVGLGVTIALVLGVVLFGKRILGVTRGQAFAVGATQFVRLAAVLALQGVQWSAALPEVPAAQWLMFLTAQMLVTRLPFMPNRDILLMWLGVTLAPAVTAPEAHVAAMFVAAGSLNLVGHALVMATSALARRTALKPVTP